MSCLVFLNTYHVCTVTGMLLISIQLLHTATIKVSKRESEREREREGEGKGEETTCTLMMT